MPSGDAYGNARGYRTFIVNRFCGEKPRTTCCSRQAVATSISFPAVVTTGAAYVWGDWTFAGDIDWYQWSAFDRIRLDFDQRNDLDQTIVEEWKDSLQFRVGAERRVNDQLAVRGGYFFDKTPSPTESVSPLLPDANRTGFTIGAGLRFGNTSVDVSNMFLFFHDRTTRTNHDNFNGTYENFTDLFVLSLRHSF